MITRSMSEIMLRRVGLQTVTALLSRAQSQKRVEEQSEERKTSSGLTQLNSTSEGGSKVGF